MSRILVVDDKEMMRDSVSTTLARKASARTRPTPSQARHPCLTSAPRS